MRLDYLIRSTHITHDIDPFSVGYIFAKLYNSSWLIIFDNIGGNHSKKTYNIYRHILDGKYGVNTDQYRSVYEANICMQI